MRALTRLLIRELKKKDVTITPDIVRILAGISKTGIRLRSEAENQRMPRCILNIEMRASGATNYYLYRT